MPCPSVDSLLLHLAEDGKTMRLSLLAEGIGKHEVLIGYRSPVQDDDASEMRWLLEDYPRLRGRSSDPIASRIEKRLHALAEELRHAVFESAGAVRPIGEALADFRLVQRLRVVVEEPPAAAWTPWELMLTPGHLEPLSVLAASFVRYSSCSPHPRPSTAPAPLRVLLVTCRPRSENDVPFRSVASRIVQAVAAAPEAGIQINVLRPPTYPALRAALAAAASTRAPYDVVHFDGHGVYRTDMFSKRRKQGYLLFEGPDGGGDELSGSILGEDLARYGVRWLLLNACRSAYTEPETDGGDSPEITERVFGSLASEVRAAGVAGVLAMGFNLYVVTAARLVADTYAALATGRDLGVAVGHARRRMYSADPDQVAGSFDWLVPITFHGETVVGPSQRRPIRKLSIKVSTTTPTSASVIDSGAVGGPRSDERPFFGYDDVLLRLDRACTAARSVEIVGLSGSGKSAVAGEFVRWWVATSPGVAVVLDMPSYPAFGEFEQDLTEQMSAAQRYAPSGGCLVVLEDASFVLDAGIDAWTHDDQTRLQQWIAQRNASAAPLILTGRTSCGVPGVETIVLEGLDAESRMELANHAGFPLDAARTAPGLLQWTQGVPEVVVQIPRIVEGVCLDGEGAVRNILSSLRSGKTDGPELGLALIERTGVEFFNVSRLQRADLPFVLHLFQGYVSDFEWKVFSESAAHGGLWLNLERAADPVTVLKEELRPAERAGLACRIPDGYLLHPLAPIAIEPGFAGTLQVYTGGVPDRAGRVMGLAWSSYIYSVTVTLTMADELRDGGAFGALNLHRENLWNAVEISLLGAWWGLALPLLHRLRDKLLLEARDQEWREVLELVFARLRESPPQEQEMGPENAELHIVRFLAEEAERGGDVDLLKALRELQLQIANSIDLTIEPVDPSKGKALDIGRINRISALLKRGDSERSPAALSFYNEALRLADESNDILRGGEVHLAIAKAHLNVPAVYDPAKYEYHARRAIEAAHSMGQFGLSLLERASVSLGNAIIEEQRSMKQPDRSRLNEARDAFSLAARSEVANSITRGTAHNGLGNLYSLEGDNQAASEEYLAACKYYEASGDTESLLVAQTNAAMTLAECGRIEDARILALHVVAGLANRKPLEPKFSALLKTINRVLAACDRPRNS